jgi:hypothetical protein
MRGRNPYRVPVAIQRLCIGIENDGIDVFGQSRLTMQSCGDATDDRCLEALDPDPLHQIV